MRLTAVTFIGVTPFKKCLTLPKRVYILNLDLINVLVFGRHELNDKLLYIRRTTVTVAFNTHHSYIYAHSPCNNLYFLSCACPKIYHTLLFLPYKLYRTRYSNYRFYKCSSWTSSTKSYFSLDRHSLKLRSRHTRRNKTFIERWRILCSNHYECNDIQAVFTICTF
jgi:hypothetical protein